MSPIYRGPILDGFHLNLGAFEEWVASERQRLTTMHRDRIQTLARETERRGPLAKRSKRDQSFPRFVR